MIKVTSKQLQELLISAESFIQSDNLLTSLFDCFFKSGTDIEKDWDLFHVNAIFSGYEMKIVRSGENFIVKSIYI